MPRVVLTAKLIAALKLDASRRTYFWDALLPNFGVMVTRRGTKSFIVYRRWPGSRAPSRRTIARCTALTLAQARDQARHWLEAATRGEDPREQQRAAARTAQRRQQATFAAVVESWLGSDEVQRTRTPATTARAMRDEFIPLWGTWPVVEVGAADIAAAIRAKAAVAPAHARNLLGYVKRLYGWIEAQHLYDLIANPAAGLKPDRLCGKRIFRQRTLTDDELAALWLAASRLAYPFGPALHLLVLTGQRRGDVAEARWPEFDLGKRLWTIPPARYKTGVAHVVPLAPAAMTLLQGLPHFDSGDFVFSTTFGKRPVSGWGAVKRRLPALEGAWVLHDIRRSMRTGLSALPVSDLVKELVIGHARPGLHRVYDMHAYLDEKRQALTLWAERLLAIVGRT
jgi:integrase